MLKIMITGNYLNVDWLKFTDPNNPGAIRMVGRDMNHALQGSVSYDVFSLSGKRLGRVDGSNLAARDLSNLLGQAGYANGIYLVRSRGSYGFTTQKVVVNK